MELEYGLGIGIALLFIDRFVVFVKVLKGKLNGNSRIRHSSPCEPLKESQLDFKEYRKDRGKEHGEIIQKLSAMDKNIALLAQRMETLHV